MGTLNQKNGSRKFISSTSSVEKIVEFNGKIIIFSSNLIKVAEIALENSVHGRLQAKRKRLSPEKFRKLLLPHGRLELTLVNIGRLRNDLYCVEWDVKP